MKALPEDGEHVDIHRENSDAGGFHENTETSSRSGKYVYARKNPGPVYSRNKATVEVRIARTNPENHIFPL